MSHPTAGLLALCLAGCQDIPSPAPTQSYADPDALYRLISSQSRKYFLVDVRTAEEYFGAHIPTAVNIALDTIGRTFPATTKNALIIVYCQSGGRSAQAARTLNQLGYRNAVDFGAITRWQDGFIQSSKAPGDCLCRQLGVPGDSAAQ